MRQFFVEPSIEHLFILCHWVMFSRWWAGHFSAAGLSPLLPLSQSASLSSPSILSSSSTSTHITLGGDGPHRVGKVVICISFEVFVQVERRQSRAWITSRDRIDETVALFTTTWNWERSIKENGRKSKERNQDHIQWWWWHFMFKVMMKPTQSGSPLVTLNMRTPNV